MAKFWNRRGAPWDDDAYEGGKRKPMDDMTQAFYMSMRAAQERKRNEQQKQYSKWEAPPNGYHTKKKYNDDKYWKSAADNKTIEIAVMQEPGSTAEYSKLIITGHYDERITVPFDDAFKVVDALSSYDKTKLMAMTIDNRLSTVANMICNKLAQEGRLCYPLEELI